MASSYSTDLKIELMVTGQDAGTWGDKTNSNWNLVQQAIAGYQAVSISGGSQTTALVMTNATISNARNAVIELTGTITGNQIVTVPDGIEKTWIISNNTTGAFTVQFKTASGTGPTFATTDKSTKILYSNGTNVIDTGIVSLTGVQTLTNKTLTSPTLTDPIINTIKDSNSNKEIIFITTTSAVNELTVTNSATGNNPSISSSGNDSNIGINFTPKGVGAITFDGTGKIQQVKEKATISATPSTGTINYDVKTQAVLYYTTSASGNFTINIRGNDTTTLNSMMNTGESITITFLSTQGTTAYYNSAISVDGSSVTPKWQGGTAPSSGNISSIDIYVYTIIKTGDAVFTVLASQTQFK
jgi:hypothetical protein